MIGNWLWLEYVVCVKVVVDEGVCVCVEMCGSKGVVFIVWL